MKRIFILEDDPMRWAMFREEFKDYQIDGASNCRDAALCFKPPYDLICLDHDLGGQQMVTGYQFCRGLTRELVGEACIVIHSYNPLGAARMARHCADNDIIFAIQPFGPTLFKLAHQWLTE